MLTNKKSEVIIVLNMKTILLYTRNKIIQNIKKTKKTKLLNEEVQILEH